MREFKRTTNGFNYVFEDKINANETIILKMPSITPNKRGINDIGFSVDDGIVLYATISSKPDSDNASLWQEIDPFDEINKTTSYIKIENTTDEIKSVIIRAILN